jgi:hypothetical protein
MNCQELRTYRPSDQPQTEDRRPYGEAGAVAVDWISGAGGSSLRMITLRRSKTTRYEQLLRPVQPGRNQLQYEQLGSAVCDHNRAGVSLVGLRPLG